MSIVSSILRMISRVYVYPYLMCAVFFLPETEEGSALHGTLYLLVLWSAYIAVIMYSPIFHTWEGFTHHPVGNVTTYTSTQHRNLDL